MSIEEFGRLEKIFSYHNKISQKCTNIGLVQLSTDHVLEPDLTKLTGTQARVLSNRVFSDSLLNSSSLYDISKRIQQSASLIAQGLALDVMMFGCTSATLMIGESEIAKYLTADHPNIPTTNPWTAAKAVFHTLNVSKIAVLSPYPTSVNYELYTQLRNAGFTVTDFASFSIKQDIYVPKIAKESIFFALENILPHSQAEIVFLSCTNLPVLDYLAEIEERFGVTAISSNSALFWHAMTLAGVQPSCSAQFGSLLHG